MPFYLHYRELMRIVMNGNSPTSRMLSLAILLLSLAPLGSILLLLFSIYSKSQPPDRFEDVEEVMVHLEKLLETVLRGEPVEEQKAKFALSVVMKREDETRHLSIVFPWLIFILLVVVVPACLSIFSFVWAHFSHHQDRRRRYDRNRDSLEKSRRKLEDRLRGFLMKLEPRHLKGSGWLCINAGNGLLAPMEETNWMIPKPGYFLPHGKGRKDKSPRMEVTTFRDYRTVTDDCAICLQSFQTGDTVVWSPNPECVHCYHESCIKPWLVRKASKNQLCPCCKQRFVRPKSKHNSQDREVELAIEEELQMESS